MGDVDWSKRSYGGYYGGADAFSSMGDVDWSKRSVGPAHQFGSDSKDKRAGGLYRSWLSRQNSPGIGQSRYHVSLRYWLHQTCVNVFSIKIIAHFDVLFLNVRFFRLLCYLTFYLIHHSQYQVNFLLQFNPLR